MNNILFESSYDPYDLWATKSGVFIKRKYYSGDFSGKLGAILMGVFDWLLPSVSRKIFTVRKRCYPIVVAQQIQILSLSSEISNNNVSALLQKLKCVASDPTGVNGWAWGLGFPWMSKNGLYSESLPFITHTPYAMEALLILSRQSSMSEEALTIFNDTWRFLESLLVMYQQDEQLALSYAPVNEPRIVVNANSYAAYAYALHAIYGKKEQRNIAEHRIKQLIHWVLAQQQNNGSWYYYADSNSGNFIDCFHSCFVIKNLLKVKKLMAINKPELDKAILDGWQFIKNNFFDNKKGLCRRFGVSTYFIQAK